MRTPSRSKIAARPIEQAVVAAAKQLRELAGALDRAPVEPEVGEFRPGDRADHRHLADAALPQRGEQLADLAQPDPDVRIGLDGGVGQPTTPIRNGSRPAPRRFGGDLERKRAGAAQDRERRRGRWPAARRGSRLLVLPLARRADRAVAALRAGRRRSAAPPPRSGKASATSSTRSFSVPLPENSIL